MTDSETREVKILIAYTDTQATDEAVLLLTRKLRRLHPDVYASLMSRLSDGARDALILADNRADLLRATDRYIGIVRHFVTISERAEMESGDEG